MENKKREAKATMKKEVNAPTKEAITEEITAPTPPPVMINKESEDKETVKEAEAEVTEEVLELNPELSEADIEEGETITIAECADDCECHEPKEFAEMGDPEDTALSLTHSTGGLEIKRDGFYVNGKLAKNPTQVYNALYAYKEAYYSLNKES